MKGPNPFAPYEDDPANICGMRDESRIFNGFADAVASGQGGVMLIQGGPGSGKTMLLRYFKGEAERKGVACPFVPAEKGENDRALVDKIWQELSYLPDFKGGPAHPDSIVKAMAAAARADKAGFGSIIFIDDLDRMRKAPEFLSAVVKAAQSAWGRSKVGFVVSTTMAMEAPSEVASVMSIKPFDERDARELIEKALKKGPLKMGDECLNSIIADSGGNPRLIKSVCRHIFEKLRDNEKVITKGHYLGYLQHIMSMLSREWFGRMYQETPAAERAILHELAREEGGMHVSDAARRLGKPLGPVTALTKRLLDSGQIVKVDRGRYRVFAKLYARYVSQRA